MSYRTSLIVKSTTRDILKLIGKKDQTYDSVIRELILFKYPDAEIDD